MARLVTYRVQDIVGAPGTTGLIGQFASRHSGTGTALLRDTAHQLLARGATRVLGPMNGSTWARYRFALQEPSSATNVLPFLGEPSNPVEYPAQFIAAGFRETAGYESRITRDIHAANSRATAAEATASARGIVVAPIELARFDDELRALHELSVRTFAGNLYYSPIGVEEFISAYTPMRALLDPSFVLLARAADASLIAYVFAYPDPVSLHAGRPHRLILKTLAVDPAWRGIGIGALLVERLHLAARARGLTAVIHALMHVDNDSMKISAHTTQLFRRYAMYEFP